MIESENLFHQIVKEIPEVNEGKMFSADCIKTNDGKVAAILWQDNMLFKLDEKSQQEALLLEGSKVASHLYDTNKPMKGWISVPFIHSNLWSDFTRKAITFIKILPK